MHIHDMTCHSRVGRSRMRDVEVKRKMWLDVDR
jgi:hypothetical protein